ncbi:MAG TPA: xanthine dehydrogenase family protein molybdopterin-binding subunit, partial [Thermodesulfobacteriota bacterium]
MRTVSRRSFLRSSAVTGAGLVIGFHFPTGVRAAAAAEPAKGPVPPNAFIRIAPDDTVTIFVPHSEMGQGIMTALPMLVAEELACDWRKVRARHAPNGADYVHTRFGMQMTGGSTSVADRWVQLRTVGAQARTMLVQAAADAWKVDPATCRAENGFVIHEPSGRRVSFGKVADRAARLPVPQAVALKEPSAFRLLGKPQHRLDGRDKVTGRATFGIDVKLEGLLTAVVARPPVFGGRVVRVDAARARAVPGVVDVVQVPSGVAVLAKDFWSAKKGRDALDVEWDLGPNASLSTEALLAQYRELGKTPGAPARTQGDAEAALATAAKVVSAEYDVPYLAHAPMEPLNCTVRLAADRCEIWTGTQFQTVDAAAAAAVAGIDPARVTIHTTYLGGGFGRRANPASDFVVEAVHVAKAAKRPVKVVWTREDDIRGGYYRPLWYDRIRAGLDADGRIVAISHTIVGQSILAGTPFERFLVKDGVDVTSVEGAANLPYEVPNVFVGLHSPRVGVPVLWWRSVGHSHNGFVVETFVDELAAAAGKDPVEFRLAHLSEKHPRHVAALRLVAEKAGWGTPLPAGRARGVALHESFGSVVAQVAEVSIENGRPKVHRVVSAVHCGFAVNPDGVAQQIESGVIYGLSAALHGEITLRDGRVEQSNFHDYPVLRLDEAEH